MTKQLENKTGFWGTYFEHDAVIKLARFANILGWFLLGFYVYMALVSLGQYLAFIVPNAAVLENLTFFDLLSIPNSYIQQLAPGLVYFVVLKTVQHVLLILLDVEDNSRRAARIRSRK